MAWVLTGQLVPDIAPAERAAVIADAVTAAKAAIVVVNPVSTAGLPNGTLIARTA